MKGSLGLFRGSSREDENSWSRRVSRKGFVANPIGVILKRQGGRFPGRYTSKGVIQMISLCIALPNTH